MVDEPEVVASLFMEDIRYLKKETLKVSFINIRNELISVEDISMGSIRTAGFAPRDIFAEAIKRGAHAIILAHNHLSGDPTPSAADISATGQIAEGGRLLGITVLDHVIIGYGRFVSLKKEGFLYIDVSTPFFLC